MKLKRLCLFRHRAYRDGNRSSQDYANSLLGVCLVVLLAISLSEQSLLSLFERADSAREQTVRWMMRAPAGLKLHTGLGDFIGTWILGFSGRYTSLMYAVLSPFASPMPVIVQWILGVSLAVVGALVGLSGLFDLVADILAIVHGHLYAISYVLSYGWSGMLRSLLCLWRLFRGLKWNPLRQRVDTCQYDLDELLFGTLFFVLLCFLSPTVFAFHVLLAVFLLPVEVLRALLSGLARVFQAFPLHRAYLWVINSSMLPHYTVYSASPSSNSVLHHQVCFSVSTISCFISHLCFLQERKISMWNACATELATEYNEWIQYSPFSSSLRWLIFGPLMT